MDDDEDDAELHYALGGSWDAPIHLTRRADGRSLCGRAAQRGAVAGRHLPHGMCGLCGWFAGRRTEIY